MAAPAAGSTAESTAESTVYDAIVIGSGISGGWAAKELTEAGLTVLMITHDMDVVAEACDRATVLYAGLSVEAGPTAVVPAEGRGEVGGVAQSRQAGGHIGRRASDMLADGTVRGADDVDEHLTDHEYSTGHGCLLSRGALMS